MRFGTFRFNIQEFGGALGESNRGRQHGIQQGEQVYDGLAKYLLMVVVHDDRLEEAIRTIEKAAFSGNPGDGKVFVTPLDAAYTIRTGKQEL